MVLVTFCTVDKTITKIEIPLDTKIAQVKDIYTKEIGNLESASLKLIFKKKILKNDDTIGSLDLKEKDFIVVYSSKKNSSNQQPSKQAEQPISNTSETSQNKEISSPVNSTNSGIPISQPSRNNSMPNDRQIQNSYLYQNNSMPNDRPIQNSYLYQNNSMPNDRPNPISFPFPSNFNSMINPIPNDRPSPMSSPYQFNPLPQYNQQSNNQYDFTNDPQFQQKVDQLREISGFGITDCESALKETYGNVDRAVEYLLNCQNPSQNYNRHNSQSSSSSIQLNQEFISTFKKMLQEEPRLLENFVEEFEMKNPNVRQNPEILLVQFGLSPENFDINGIRNYAVKRVEPKYFDQLLKKAQSDGSCPMLQSSLEQINYGHRKRSTKRNDTDDTLLNQFSQEERDAIMRIKNLGNFILNDVIQIFLACEKNEQMAANLMFSYNK